MNETIVRPVDDARPRAAGTCASSTLLGHISPAVLEHVNPYGTDEFPIASEDARTGYRPLRSPVGSA